MLSSRQRPAPFRTWMKALTLAAMPLSLAACQSSAPADMAKLRPAAAIISSDGNAFIGLSHDELANALGTPQMVRKEAPAEVWQYGGADCVVDFYLYDTDGQLRVAYVEARDMRAASAPTDRCVTSLLQWVSVPGISKTL